MPTDEMIKIAQSLKFTKKMLNSKEAHKAMDEGLIEGLE